MIENKLEICDRIKHIRKTLGMTQIDFAGVAGITQSYLSTLERRDKTPSDAVIKAICHGHNINETWLVSGSGDLFAKEQQECGIPVFCNLPGSFPAFSNNDVFGYIAIPGLPPKGFAVQQRGEFMAPTIKNGDIVICEPVKELVHDDLVLIKNLWGTWIFRRFRQQDDRAMLTPDNPVYRPFPYNEKEQYIVARVYRILRDVYF